ncbi:MAG: hypothetical protein ABGY75_15340 [Gemmataceae bacterium]
MRAIKLKLTAGILLGASLAAAQPPAPPARPRVPTAAETGKPIPPGEETTSRDHDDAYPGDLSPAKLVLTPPGGSERVVRIHQRDPNAGSAVRGRYFHRPLLAFATRDTPHAGYPDIVWDVDADSCADGTVAVYFRVITSTPELRQRARDAVLRDDRAAAVTGGTQDDVHVQPWPLKHCVVFCKNPSSDEILAAARTDTLTGKENEFTFVLRFGPDELRKFRQYAARNRLEFVFSYSYKGAKTYTGSVELRGPRTPRCWPGSGCGPSRWRARSPSSRARRTTPPGTCP